MSTTIKGPGIVLECFPDEVVRDDPGAGTPCMVYAGKDGAATYTCALYTGEVDGYVLSDAQLAWLESPSTVARIDAALGQAWLLS